MWILFKYPIFVKIKNENLENSQYNIYSKNIGFWSCLYLGFFDFFLKQNNSVSLFSGVNLKMGVKDKTCKFVYDTNAVKQKHRFFDVLLAIVCSISILFIGKIFSKYDTPFGITLSIFIILFVYRKIFINYIYSINIGTYKNYKLNIMYPHSIFEGIFSNIYALAYDVNKTVLLHKDVYFGGDRLKEYVMVHEEGHLVTKNPKKGICITFLFIIASFFGIAGPTIISDICPDKNYLHWIPCISYLIFLLVFNFIASNKNKEDEQKADIYAIKKIGKDAVLNGLKIIKNDKLSQKMETKLSGTEMDRRIIFVEKYNE